VRSALPAPRAERLLRASAIATAALCVAATVATVWLDVLLAGGDRPPDPLDWAHWGSAGSGLPLAVAGGVLATRLPRHPLTWLLLAGGTIALGMHDRQGMVTAAGVVGMLVAVFTILSDLGMGLMTAAGLFTACALIALIAGLLTRRRSKA
jgi:hypothetical protein